MKFLSLFSGVGGFDLALERAGMHCVGQAERDKQCLKVLTHHWPNVPKYEDVRNVTTDNTPTVDVVCGGFPCQDVSVAGRRAGLAGERSGLWFEFLRILTDLTPQWVVIENVPGLLHSQGGRDFATILYGLGECGYRTSWRVLDAQYFGVAQRRRRVFLVASLGNGRSAQVLFERESSTGNTKPRQAERQGITAIAGTLTSSASGVSRPGNGETDIIVPQSRVYGQQAYGAYRDDTVASTLNATDYKHATDLIAYNVTFCDANGRRSDRPNGGLYVNETERSNTLTGKGIHAETVITYGFKHNASPSQGMTLGEDIMPTLTVNDGKGFSVAHQMGVRRLTPLECERLQGFPDGWTAVDGMPDSQRYRQMGNAIAVPVVEWIARRIMEFAAE